MKKFTVNENCSLKDFTDATYPQGSFAYSRLLKRGDIKVNGVKVRANTALAAGDEVIFYTTPQEEGKPSHTVIYEDENILVVDKLGGVSSEALFCELKACGNYYPVHRLDRNTVGLLLLAKSVESEQALIAAFKERTVDKVYLCLCKNGFKEGKGVLTAYLKKNAEAGKVRVYATPAQDRVKIVTEYEVVKSYGDYCLVKVILHTGKTHQIRAHLAFIGCPVLGDEKYGDFALNKKYCATRQILVAKSLSFNLTGALSYLNEKQFTSNFFPCLPSEEK